MVSKKVSVKAGFKIDAEATAATSTLRDRLLQALAGQSVNIAISKIQIKSSAGTVLGEVSVSPANWSNYTLSVDVPISVSGTVDHFALVAPDGAELFTYTPTPFSVAAGDVVHIEWTLSLNLGSNMNSVSTRILEFIIGAVSDITIATVVFAEAGSLRLSDSPDSVTPDTANDRVTVSGSVTIGSTEVTYDEVWLRDSSGNELFKISASGYLEPNTTYNYTIEVSMT